ncbi:MAG: EscU/YscU/HrcU family type III secretion system export apparatus switch protein [Actinomycetota bacterium]
MAGEDRTEKPTAKRRGDARAEGQVAKSQDVGVALSLIALIIVVVALGPGMMGSAQVQMASILRNSGEGPFVPGLGSTTLDLVLTMLLPVLVLAVIVAIVGGVAQTGLKLSRKAAKPRLKNLSLKRGVAKFKPQQVGWELLRTVLKLVLLIAVSIAPIQAILTEVDVLRPVDAWFALTMDLVRSVLYRATALAVVIAIADYAWNRYTTEKQMKMTKQEVRDETKQMLGDSSVRGRRMAKARELNRNRVISSVGTADVVIVNPVRFAVALAYTEGDTAPRVVAKGAGAMARRIRNEAYRHGVPVRQDPPLARALFRRCQVGQHVPAALYEAVAAVLAAVYQRRWRRQSAVTVR